MKREGAIAAALPAKDQGNNAGTLYVELLYGHVYMHLWVFIKLLNTSIWQVFKENPNVLSSIYNDSIIPIRTLLVICFVF